VNQAVAVTVDPFRDSALVGQDDPLRLFGSGRYLLPKFKLVGEAVTTVADPVSEISNTVPAPVKTSFGPPPVVP